MSGSSPDTVTLEPITLHTGRLRLLTPSALLRFINSLCIGFLSLCRCRKRQNMPEKLSILMIVVSRFMSKF